MENITPDQKNKLETWAEQRDILLDEVSRAKNEKNILVKQNYELNEAKSQTLGDIHTLEGRLFEMKKTEDERKSLVSQELANLETRKKILEVENSSLRKENSLLEDRKEELKEDIESALITFNTIKDETLLLDKVVDRVTEVSAKNSNRIKSIIDEVEKSLTDIVNTNKKNVEGTNEVIEKLPQILMELQKRNLIKPRQKLTKPNI